MDPQEVRRLLAAVRSKRVKVDEAMQRLRSLPTEHLGYARYDTHRALRRGFPEVILAQGKTDDQVLGILQRIAGNKHPILVTRASEELYVRAVEHVPAARYHELARAITVDRPGRRPPLRRGLTVITAGTADIRVAEEAAVTAEIMGNEAERIYDVGVAGIHRLLEVGQRLQRSKVIVVAAGMEGALPSVVGGLVAVPVIAVPTSVGYGASFGGVAALLGMLNSCASGLTVVNIDNGFGAGYAASQILSLIPSGASRRRRD
ncbi:MAG: nickel pincer cofactor biosynthesis protein LarB [Candidatus Polarisedimenticolia bacterium]